MAWDIAGVCAGLLLAGTLIFCLFKTRRKSSTNNNFTGKFHHEHSPDVPKRCDPHTILNDDIYYEETYCEPSAQRPPYVDNSFTRDNEDIFEGIFFGASVIQDEESNEYTNEPDESEFDSASDEYAFYEKETNTEDRHAYNGTIDSFPQKQVLDSNEIEYEVYEYD